MEKEWFDDKGTLRQMLDKDEAVWQLIKGFKTKFEPINRLSEADDNQITEGFECLLTHEKGFAFGEIISQLKESSSLTVTDALILTDVASFAVHFDTIRKLSRALNDKMPRVFFSFNISKELLSIEPEVTKSILAEAQNLPISNLTFELSEEIRWRDRIKVNQTLQIIRKIKSSVYLDDVYMNAGPNQYLDYMQDDIITGLKFDHERFWEDVEYHLNGQKTDFHSKIKTLFGLGNYKVIVEGVRNQADLDFIFDKSEVFLGRNISIQGEFAEPQAPFNTVLSKIPSASIKPVCGYTLNGQGGGPGDPLPKKFIKVVSLIIIAIAASYFLIVSPPETETKSVKISVFQNFEEKNGSLEDAYYVGSDIASCELVKEPDHPVHEGKNSIKVQFKNQKFEKVEIKDQSIDLPVGSFCINPASQGPVDLSTSHFISMWVFDTVGGNTVRLILRDAQGQKSKSAWGNHGWSEDSAKPQKDKWSKIVWDLDQFIGVDKSNITSFELAEWHSGTYYFDNVQIE